MYPHPPAKGTSHRFNKEALVPGDESRKFLIRTIFHIKPIPAYVIVKDLIKPWLSNKNISVLDFIAGINYPFPLAPENKILAAGMAAIEEIVPKVIIYRAAIVPTGPY
jgi:hypothetical protein